MFSASSSTFNEDLGVSFTAEQQAAGTAVYNYTSTW
jgi:predicted dithiol-disulfide oxidoreductase (DUF899 family)